MMLRLRLGVVIAAGLLFLSVTAAYGSEKEKKVLIIGIDGCRPDALLAAQTPNLDAIWKNGAYSFKAKTDEISSSGPCWTAMLTGVWHNKHGVVSNDYKQPDLENYPHFFQRIRLSEPGLNCYSMVNWGPIHKILQEGDAVLAASETNDVNVTKKVVDLLGKDAVDVIFVQLDEVDGAGHRHDYTVNSKKYLQAIERSDRQVGRMMQALEQRAGYEKEDWLILVSTDHGGSKFGHGKNIPEHTTIFYMAHGQSVARGEIEKEVGVVDVAVTALFHLGITIKNTWNLDGSVAGL